MSVCGPVSLLSKIHAVLPVLDGARYCEPLVPSTQVSISRETGTEVQNIAAICGIESHPTLTSHIRLSSSNL